jgi:hypothetical protein
MGELVADSAYAPTLAQCQAFLAAGGGAWLGYLASGKDVDILNPWTEAEFDLVRSSGLLTAAYVSGQDNPTWLKTTAAAWGLTIILDCEGGIRADGTWVDPFLATSGAGLYGGSAVQANHRTHNHPFYVFALYPTAGNPSKLQWPSGVAAPPQPTGWQYADNGSFGGHAVDLSIFDPAILGGVDMTPAQAQMLQDLHDIFFLAAEGSTTPPGNAPWSNVEVLRRQNTDLGAPYSPNALNPFVPDPPGPVNPPAAVTLAPPHVYSQLSSATDPWDACGETDVASVVTDSGSGWTPSDVVKWAVSAGAASANGETTAANLVAELVHYGIPATVVAQPIATALPAALARKHELLVTVSCDSDGNPVTPGTATHWLLAYGISSSGYAVMQPLGSPPGSLQTYPVALLDSCDKQSCVEVEFVLPKDA